MSRLKAKNQVAVMAFLKGNIGWHRRRDVEAGTGLARGSVISALQSLLTQGAVRRRRAQGGQGATAAWEWSL